MKFYYIGLNVHKKIIAYCIKTQDGEIFREGTVASIRATLHDWAEELPGPWVGALEATLFSGWIYDFLKPYAMDLKVAHPQMLKAIAAPKKKNDKVDARMIADLLRCNLLSESYMASERGRELRRVLRYRKLMVGESVRMKNKISGLLMEVGATYAKRRLHGKNYFAELLESVEDVPESVIDLLRLSRGNYELFDSIQRRLVNERKSNPEIAGRVKRLMTIDGVGEITALTWILEIDDPMRFSKVKQAISYCGLCSAQRESAGKSQRGPKSKQRNRHLQTVLIEAANLAPRWSPELAELHAREIDKGHRNRATLAVARKLCTFMLAVDKRGTNFKVHEDIKAA